MDFSNHFNYLEGKKIFLVLIEKNLGNNEMIPFYYYDIFEKESKKRIGKISIRIGSNYHSYYNGHIGFEIDEPFRGNNYSLEACILVLQVARYHQMTFIYLTCDKRNIASSRIIEKLGSKLIEEVVPPKDFFGYYDGMKLQKIYKLNL